MIIILFKRFCMLQKNQLIKFLLICCMSTGVLADNDQKDEPVSWYILSAENDAFGVLDKSDDGYSNGIGFAWGYAPFKKFDDIDMPQWIRFLSKNTYLNQADKKNYSIGYAVSQSMYTPKDLSRSDLIIDDRPYAGTLLWQSKLRTYGDNVTDSLGLVLGVLGPASLAEQTQTRIHEMIGTQIPQGWDNQLDNEPVFRVEAERSVRFADIDLGESTGFDTSLYSQAGLGNLLSDVGVGFTFRFGNILDQSYAFINPAPARSANAVVGPTSKSFNWQVFASVFGRYVFNDITLDGNTFKDSHSVELVNEQGLVSLGLAVNWENWGLIFSTQRGTRQFEGQESKTNFGALSLSYHH